MKAKKRITRAARELYRLCLSEGVLDAGRAIQVAERLAQSTRRGALPVLSEFQRFVRLERDQRTALVESAAPMDGAMRDRIRTRLAGLYGPAIETQFGENPSLIGGVRIRVGSDVYDGSVRARLAELEARL